MKILIIDDKKEKVQDIKCAILEVLDSEAVQFDYADCMAKCTLLLANNIYDLIIIDLYLPFTSGGKIQDAGNEIVNAINFYPNAKNTYVFALSESKELVKEKKEFFEDNGIILLHYTQDSIRWKASLHAYVIKISSEIKLDFAIICALDEERNAFLSTEANCSEKRELKNLDYLPMTIGKLKGACILMPRMGLVEASIISTRVIETLNPRLIAMSGICGGFKNNSDLGEILIPDPCWEYQSGKWSESGFLLEPYHTDLVETTRIKIHEIAESVGLLDELENGFDGERPRKKVKPKIAPFTTGSAVVADKEKALNIQKEHRKSAGLDMELYGVYKAAKLSCRNNLIYFGAKTVVDLADAKKDDSIHAYGCLVSARFVVKIIPQLLK